jgi:hypothetical protein
MSNPDPPPVVQKSIGRPRGVQERLEVVSARLPIATYDDLVRSARAQQISVSCLVRRILILRLQPHDS